jgi:hypothetical protein
MLKHTTWHPDTCKCVITYSWDSTVPADERVHTFTAIKPCPLHALATARGADPAEAIALVAQAAHAENVRKNQAIATVVEHWPGLDPNEVAWRIDEARRVHLAVPAREGPPARALPSATDTRGLQQALDARFGAGVIVLE